MNPVHFMNKAFQNAKKAYIKDEVPVGAILVHKNKIIASHHNLMRHNHSSIDHAELLCAYDGIKAMGSPYLDECDLYVTLEPCPMCASTLKHLRIRNIYFGAYDTKGGGIVHGPRLFDFLNTHTEYYGGFMEDQCSKILQDFFKNKRY
jgi:tRNA(adenine34) deaminase